MKRPSSSKLAQHRAARSHGQAPDDQGIQPGSFGAIVATAHRATPFGRFNAVDRQGLIKRAIAMGLHREAAEAVIAELTRARGIL
jgi:hypothetical protein